MKVKSKVGVGLAWIALCIAPTTSNAWCCADDWCCDDWNYKFSGDAQLSGGYRYDEISASINSFDAPGVFVSQDKLKIKKMHIWEVGGKARVTLGNVYIRGYGYTGWGSHGKYTERVSDGIGDFSVSRADVKHIRTQDALVGLGYMFTTTDCSGNCWGIAPIAGWSYAHQRVKLKDGNTNGFEDLIFDGLVYKNRWSGPWLGFDVSYAHCDFSVNAGYEYHWANWHAEWLLDDVDVLPNAFSDRRHAKNAHGNVVYIDGFWSFACNWEIGLGFKFQEWNARKGHVEPIAGLAAAGLLPTAEDKLKHAKWCSAELTLNLVYDF